MLVHCAECGLEIKTANTDFPEVPKAEMKRKCKLAKQPRFDFDCPFFGEAVGVAARAAALPKPRVRVNKAEL
jgi:hypothetical protein